MAGEESSALVTYVAEWFGTDKAAALSMDPLEPALVVNDDEHVHIHRGKAWRFSQLNQNVAAGGVVLIEFRVSPTAGEHAHFRVLDFVSSGPKCRWELLEAPTIATPGTNQLTPANCLRGANTPNPLTAFSNPIGVSGGNVIDMGYIGGGTGVGSSSTGGSSAEQAESVLATGITYVLRLTNGGSGSSDMFIKTFWYE